MNAMKESVSLLILCLLFLGVSCSEPPAYDVVIRGGLLYDGSGARPRVADIAIIGDSIAAIGQGRIVSVLGNSR